MPCCYREYRQEYCLWFCSQPQVTIWHFCVGFASQPQRNVTRGGGGELSWSDRDSLVGQTRKSWCRKWRRRSVVQTTMALELYLDLYSQPCRSVYIFAKKNNIPFDLRRLSLLDGEFESTHRRSWTYCLFVQQHDIQCSYCNKYFISLLFGVFENLCCSCCKLHSGGPRLTSGWDSLQHLETVIEICTQKTQRQETHFVLDTHTWKHKQDVLICDI